MRLSDLKLSLNCGDFPTDKAVYNPPIKSIRRVFWSQRLDTI